MSRKKPVDQMSLKIESRSVNESFARVAVSAFVAQQDPTVEEISDIKTAVSEAVTNCIVHAYPASVGEIYIWVGLFDDGLVRIRIRDRGCGIIDVRQAMEPLFTTLGGERAGLGFAVMESFMDKVRVRSVPGKGTSVTMDKFIKAAENFDPERGFSFSTYAVPVILGEIKRIFRDGGSVKVGRALKEKARAAMREKDALTAELGCEPTVGQLAERLGSDVAQTAQLLNAAMPAVSLTACTDDGEGQIDLPVESPENAASELIALREVIALLDDRDREMISLRYYRGMTQSRTAELLGMSQVQVSRREKAVLALLRRNLSA